MCAYYALYREHVRSKIIIRDLDYILVFLAKKQQKSSIFSWKINNNFGYAKYLFTVLRIARDADQVEYDLGDLRKSYYMKSNILTGSRRFSFLFVF